MSIGRQGSPGATDTLTEHTTRKGITSRFSNLFGSRTSHIKDFSIRLEEDDISQGIKQYGPGDHVKGKVILDVARPLGITHVVVRLSGFVDVFKNHKHRVSQSSENGRMSKRRGRRWTSEYFGDGFASLFEDEIVVCGDGRLDPRPWHFEFSIGFPSQLDLPSSIKFERGQISYSVTATLTRPAAINPSISTERSVKYRDNIDVGRYPPPRAREATLKPVNSQSSSKASLRRLTSSDKDKQSSRTSTASSLRQVDYKRDSVASGDAPASTIVSSRHSSSSHNTESVVSIPLSSSDAPSRQPVLITHVSVGLTKGACLPGQTVHVLIKVDNHQKAVWRRNGIIVTLHRESRTDFQPNLPLSANAETQGKYEDYYPRSRTGIGGMSMDNAGSDKKFQQDLSQTIAPLLINPGTMSTEIKVAVRVPADAIPTIKGVPGNMISFRYYVETIIDIQGKLSMHDRAIAGATADPGANEEAQMTIWAPNCIDTTSLRQHKHAIRLKSELIIGTSNSTRSMNNRNRLVPAATVSLGSQERLASPQSHTLARHENGANCPVLGSCASGAHPTQGSDRTGDEAYDNQWGYDEYDDYDYDQWPDGGGDSGYDYNYHDNGTSSHGYSMSYYDPPPHIQVSADRPDPPLPFIPLPSTAGEEGLSEKQRLARHEAALLPSQPDGPASSTTQLPSAPPLLEVDGFMTARDVSSSFGPEHERDAVRTYGSQLSSARTPTRERPHDSTAVTSPNGRSRPRSPDEPREHEDRGSSQVRSSSQTDTNEQTTSDTLPEDHVIDSPNTVKDGDLQAVPNELNRSVVEAEPQGPSHGKEEDVSEAGALPRYDGR